MPAELFLARRYLFAHGAGGRGTGGWGWLIGWLATGSVAVGVASLIVTLAVMTGFREDIREKILGIQPHVLLSPHDGRLNAAKPDIQKILSESRDVEVWSPFVTGQILIGRGSQSSGALVKGIDPEKEPRVANLEKRLVESQWTDLPQKEGGKARIFLGLELARNLGARKGDTVWLITPGSIGITALSLPKAHLFVVAGFVQSGLYDYDSSLAYIHMPEAQRLFGLGDNVSGIGIRLKDPERAESVARDLQIRFAGAYWVRSWLSLNRNLFAALKLEKTVMFIILILVTVVAAVMIVSNLLLSIAQKVKDIGILRAMGTTAASIHRIFLLQGALMGVIGTLVGVTLGVGISLILAKTDLIRLPADVYYIDRLPVRLDVADIVTVMAAAILIVLVATLYPAKRAAKLDPLDAIRYG